MYQITLHALIFTRRRIHNTNAVHTMCVVDYDSLAVCAIIYCSSGGGNVTVYTEASLCVLWWQLPPVMLVAAVHLATTACVRVCAYVVCVCS